MERVFNDLLNLPVAQLLGLSVIGTLITVLGTLLGTVLKDFFLARSLEKWKADRSLLSVYHRYRDPIFLASAELSHRLGEIVFYMMPDSYLRPELLQYKRTEPVRNLADDPQYMKYKLVSTIYRFCAFFGWLELYRQEITYLDSGRSKVNVEIERSIRKVREDLADGDLNVATDWSEWKDSLLFREEQRAIGESVIETLNDDKSVIGYSKFTDILLDGSDSVRKQWINIAMDFLLDLDCNAQGHDFRRARCLLLIVHLVNLMESLDTNRVTNKERKLRHQAKEQLNNYAIRM